MPSTPTHLTIRVIANDGKFLGDDIGGAFITLRDADTREILAQGNTSGDSGPNGSAPGITPVVLGVMCASLKRGQPIPRDATTSAFNATLNLDRPRRLEISAFGPLAARGSAQTATTTQWVYPGRDITAGNGILLELSGLIVQIITPPTHTVAKAPTGTQVIANVAMMCGCPIDYKPANAICPTPAADQPWNPADFEVTASIVQVGNPTNPFATLTLAFDKTLNTAGRFVAGFPNVPLGTYQITVCAWQKSTGNTGVDMATYLVAK